MKAIYGIAVAGLLFATTANAQALGDVARKERARSARENRKVRTFTNDDLPAAGMISTVGQEAPPASTDKAAKDANASDSSDKNAADSANTGSKDKSTGDKTGASAKASTDGKSATDASGDDETTWRQRFAKAREQLALDQRELDVAQRELNLMQQQYYSDPNKALKEQTSRSDIDKRTADIDKLKSKVEADKAAISSLEDELRKKGLPPGWARE